MTESEPSAPLPERRNYVLSTQAVPAVQSWDEPQACHGAHLVQPDHWTSRPHHFSRCHSDALLSMDAYLAAAIRRAEGAEADAEVWLDCYHGVGSELDEVRGELDQARAQLAKVRALVADAGTPDAWRAHALLVALRAALDPMGATEDEAGA